MAQARLEVELVGKQWVGEVESVIGMTGRRQTIRAATFDALIEQATAFFVERAMPAPLLSAADQQVAVKKEPGPADSAVHPAPQKPPQPHTKK